MRYVRNIFIGISFFLVTVATVFFTFQTVYADDATNIENKKPTIENAGSDFQPSEQEKPKTELTPSSTGMGETTEILIRFMILWSIIYLVIKFVRMWLDKHK